MWQSAAPGASVGLALALLVGRMNFRHLPRPLRSLAPRMQGLQVGGVVARGWPTRPGDEMANLIDNAIRHGLSERPLRVSLQCSEQGVEVLMEDDGPGQPAELSRRLDAGQPLRDPPSARPGGGFGGLGLAIAQRIAWLHGGSLRTLPAPTGGTRLSLTLPLVAKTGTWRTGLVASGA